MRKTQAFGENTQWSVFRGNGELAVVPQTPLLIRLRQMTSDAFFGQDALAPLKRLLDTNFMIGPVCILGSMYMSRFGGLVLGIGVVSLILSSFYWFASHWLCSLYLRYRGFSQEGPVQALDLESARAAAS